MHWIVMFFEAGLLHLGTTTAETPHLEAGSSSGAWPSMGNDLWVAMLQDFFGSQNCTSKLDV